MRAADIHARLGSSWPAVLAQLGIADSFLRPKRAGPFPVCGGRDRYTFDNRNRRGDYICRHCGAGDGFRLLGRVHGWSFSEARSRVLQAIGVSSASETPSATRCQSARTAELPAAMPSQRV
jgi:phage/plasmid primase-like uncharacterized protein